MTQLGEPVKLYLYDLSQGMARQLSVAMTGRYFEAIWHSSVVVYGREYYFGQGIMTSTPGATMHGQPVEIVDVGTTFLPADVVEDYVSGMRQEFSADKYHLLKFNCNTFSDSLIKGLTGGSVPDKVKNLPDDFLETALGRQLLPMLESSFGQAARSAPAADLPVAAPPLVDFAKVQSVASYSDLQAKLQQYKAVVVYFTSFSCPPCRVIAPIYEDLVKEKNNASAVAAGHTVLAIKVDCSLQNAVAAPFNVRSTPTFMFFLDGQLTDQFAGADAGQLRSGLDLLVFSAYPPRKHTRLSPQGLEAVGLNYILFKQTASLEPVFKRINESVVASAENDEKKVSMLAGLASLKRDVGGVLEGQHMDVGQVVQQLREVYEFLPLESSFPVVDLVRMVAAVSPFSLDSVGAELVRKVVADVGSSYSADEAPPKALALLSLRLACNMFAAPQSIGIALSAEWRRQTTDLLVSSLLAAEPSVRRTAASLAFNIAAYIARARRNQREVDDEDWQIELVSAIIKGVEDESASTDAKESVPVVSRLLAALAHILYLAPESILDLARLLNAQQVARSANATSDALVTKVVADIESLLSAN
ncbi:hypothetical protein EC988_003284 [Linderina pennispora]|nr:hypothetical protein EC988_003284 [Linderina pennispora]